MKKRHIFLILISIIIIAIIAYGIYYVNDYYHADGDALSYLNNTDVIETPNGLLLDGAGNETALIFYPGAKVEYTSYLPMLSELSKKGIDCYLVEMPYNIAFLGQNAADDIINEGNYSHYFMAGHSLGGVVASSYVNSTNKTDGLILFAAYPTNEIQKPVLSIYGSNDNVFSIDSYNQAKPLMSNLTEFVIEGANHAQVGNYGNQTGDGVAKISSKEQQSQSIEKIVEFINQIV